jgi:hypothetical protein
MNSIRLTRSTIVLNAPGTGPLGLLRVCHAENEDPVARLKSVLAGLPPMGHEAAPLREARSVNWSQVMSLIKNTDWSAHQLYVEHVDQWDVLPIEASDGES